MHIQPSGSSVSPRSATVTAPYHPCGDGPSNSCFEFLSSESPPVGWSLSTRTIRSYLGGGPDSSRRPGNPEWEDELNTNGRTSKVGCATRVLSLLTLGEINEDLGLSTASKTLFEYCIEPIRGLSYFSLNIRLLKSKMNFIFTMYS